MSSLLEEKEQLLSSLAESQGGRESVTEELVRIREEGRTQVVELVGKLEDKSKAGKYCTVCNCCWGGGGGGGGGGALRSHILMHVCSPGGLAHNSQILCALCVLSEIVWPVSFLFRAQHLSDGL